MAKGAAITGAEGNNRETEAVQEQVNSKAVSPLAAANNKGAETTPTANAANAKPYSSP